MSTVKWKFGTLCVVAMALSAPTWVQAGNAAQESVQVADLQVFPTGEVIDGAVILVRDFAANVVTANLTGSLGSENADHSFSIWWVVFNNPEYCATPYACAASDIGNSQVRASAFWAGGFVTDGTGHVNTGLRLVTGKTEREVFAGSALGLQAIRTAEIHLVLRTHGPAGQVMGPGPVATQIGTASQACPEPMCMNQFFSVHNPN